MAIMAFFASGSGGGDDLITKLKNKSAINLGQLLGPALGGDYFHYRVGGFGIGYGSPRERLYRSY